MRQRGVRYFGNSLLLLLVTFAVAFQFQHLVFSTARLKNDSASPLLDVLVHLGNRTALVGEISPDDSKFLWLPAGGESSFSIEFTANGQSYSGCSEYVEGRMYHVRATVSATFTFSCSPELGLFSRLMILELL